MVTISARCGNPFCGRATPDDARHEFCDAVCWPKLTLFTKERLEDRTLSAEAYLDVQHQAITEILRSRVPGGVVTPK